MGLTGCVIDSGDGVTHIIPVSDGYVIGSCIKHIPLAGRDITKYIMRMIRERNEGVTQEDLMAVSREVKDTYSYIAKNPLLEFEVWDERVKKYEANPEKAFRTYKTQSLITKQPLEVSIGYEVFMGPEMFFRPEIVDQKWKKGLHTHLDETIQSSPIDTRRNLYQNIV